MNLRTMRLYTRKHATETNGPLGPAGYTPLELSSQRLYTVHDALELVQSKLPQVTRACAEVDTIFLRFENEWVSVYSQAELRLAVELAVVYHNKLVTEHCQHERDLNGRSYGEAFHMPECAPHKDNNSRPEVDELDESFEDASSFVSCESIEQTLDPDYEMNQDLVPWKQECGRWYKSLEEKYGFYM